MGKLIDADWLKAQWSEPTDWMDGDQVLHHYTWFKMMLELAPTVDAVPVRHGRWRHYEGMLYCSECGTEFYDDIMEWCGDHVPKFCPECGADMRKDGGDG